VETICKERIAHHRNHKSIKEICRDFQSVTQHRQKDHQKRCHRVCLRAESPAKTEAGAVQGAVGRISQGRQRQAGKAAAHGVVAV